MVDNKIVKIVLISLEGIVLDTRSHLKEYIEKNTKMEFNFNSESFDVLEILKPFDNKFEIINDFTSSGQWDKTPIIEGAKEGLSSLRERGFKILLISQIDKTYGDLIEERLKKENIEFDAFIATGWATENQNLINFYYDILKPQMTILSSLSVLNGFKQKYGKISYLSPLNHEENINHKFTQGKNLIDFLSKQ